MKKYIIISAIVIVLIIAYILIGNSDQFKAGELEPCSNMQEAVCKTECDPNEQQYINGDCGEPSAASKCCVSK